MFDIASGELLLVALVALLVIGPKDLPRVLRVVGNWVGKARGVANQFRAGFDEMVRQSELEELEKKWAAENARIMAEHPAPEAEAERYDSAPPPEMTPLPEAPTAAPKAKKAPAKRPRKKAASE
jgi:sec-independent protein translocase protein TatB